MKNTLFVSLLLAAALAASCAVSPEEDEYASFDNMMGAWMRVNYPGVSPYGSYGAYVLQMDKGDGVNVSVSDTAFIRAHYIKRSLDGTIIDSNIQEIAEQLGTYAVSSNYDGNTWQLGKGYLPDAMEEVLRSMRSGGSTTIALPYSASTHDYAIYDAFSSTQEGNNYIFELSLDTVITDIIDYQDQAMKAWFREHYTSEATIADHLYFKKLEEMTAETDTIAEGTTINVWYIGRLMNGQVFDTNIEDTAKFYRIWSSSGSYSALSLTYYKSDDEQFNSNNSVVTGFGQAILQMNYGEKAVTLFNSDLGYGAEGSNPSIPEYSPLCFWLYIDPTEDD